MSAEINVLENKWQRKLLETKSIKKMNKSDKPLVRAIKKNIEHTQITDTNHE